jgi:maleylpyruvate isomerase
MTVMKLTTTSFVGVPGAHCANLKGLAFEYIPVHLTKGEQRMALRSINAQALVPTLVDDAVTLPSRWRSSNISTNAFRSRRCCPRRRRRARVRAIALAIACDIHPLNNFASCSIDAHRGERRRQERLVSALDRHRLGALEAQLANDAATGAYCHGDAATLADICLVPQLANARRFGIALDAYPTLLRIDANCHKLDAFAAAAPEAQPDAA